MDRKTARVVLDGDGLRFVVRTGGGHTLVLDSGDNRTGASPAELIPAAVAGCTAMDVISILRKKRQAVKAYEVQATGQQRDGQPAVFTRIDIVHVVEGDDLEVVAVRRAVELSATRYCSVGGTLATGVTEIHHRYVVSSGGVEHRGEVVVTGPGEDPDALGIRATPVGAA